MNTATQEAQVRTWTIQVSTFILFHVICSSLSVAGFFSIQVLENALKVWGLKSIFLPAYSNCSELNGFAVSLMRWRGQDMRRYQDHSQ